MTPEEIQEQTVERIVSALKDSESYIGAREQVRCVRIALNRLADDYDRDGSYTRNAVILIAVLRLMQIGTMSDGLSQ